MGLWVETVCKVNHATAYPVQVGKKPTRASLEVCWLALSEASLYFID